MLTSGHPADTHKLEAYFGGGIKAIPAAAPCQSARGYYAEDALDITSWLPGARQPRARQLINGSTPDPMQNTPGWYVDLGSQGGECAALETRRGLRGGVLKRLAC